MQFCKKITFHNFTMGRAHTSKADADLPVKAASSPSKVFISNSPSRPKVIIGYDDNVKLALVQLKNCQGRAVQYVGKLPSAEEELLKNDFIFVGTKKEKYGEGPVSEKNCDYTNYQRVFVYSYEAKEGQLNDILTEAGNKFKNVSSVN